MLLAGPADADHADADTVTASSGDSRAAAPVPSDGGAAHRIALAITRRTSGWW